MYNSNPFDLKSFTLGIISLGVIFLSTNIYPVLAIMLIFSFLVVYISRKNPIIFISVILIAYTNYSIFVLRYFHPDILYINQYLIDDSLDSRGARVMAFFIVLLYYLIMKYKRLYPVSLDAKEATLFADSRKSNSILVYTICAILVAIWGLFYKFNVGERSGYSPIYEYSTVFFIIGFYLAGNKRTLRLPLLALAGFYILMDFMGGQRSTGVQIAIIVVLCNYYKYITARRVLLLGVIGILGTTLVAIFRASFIAGNISISSAFEKLSELMFASDTSGFAYYTSLTFIGTMDHYTLIERIGQFVEFALSQIVVGTVGEAVTERALRFYVHYYGGILPIYLYYYLGFFGTALICFVVATYYKIMMKIESNRFQTKPLMAAIVIYVSATTIRWYLYSPNQILRGVLLLSIVFIVFNKLSGIIRS